MRPGRPEILVPRLCYQGGIARGTEGTRGVRLRSPSGELRRDKRARNGVGNGTLRVPERLTPSPEVAKRAIEILRLRDEQYKARTGRPRAYHLAAVDLYAAIAAHLESAGEILVERRAYHAAWRRAVRAAGGRAAGTHGLRRLSTREFFRAEFSRLVASGMSPKEARPQARAAAVERLGHSRDRTDQAMCYLGPAA